MKTAFCFFAFFLGVCTAKIQLSGMIPICDATDRNLNACVVKSANLLVPFLSKGIKSYGFPPLDPLKVSKMDFGQGAGPVTLKLELINTTHLGLSSLHFHSALINTKENLWVLNGTLPFYSLSGRYKGNGRILVVPLVGDGKANFTFRDTGIDFVIKGTPKGEKSNVYFEPNSLRVYFNFGKSSITLTNLLGRNRLLGEQTSKFVRDNSDEVVNGLKDTLEDVYSALYLNLLRIITSNVPYAQMLNNV